jgi:hypothetical protein
MAVLAGGIIVQHAEQLVSHAADHPTIINPRFAAQSRKKRLSGFC